MIVKYDQCESRIDSPNNLLEVIKRKIPDRGAENLSRDEKVDIAFESRIKSNKEVAAQHGVTSQTVCNIANGRDTIKPELSKDVLDKAEEKLVRVRDEAVDKLMCALGLLTPDKMARQDAKNISNIAANLSKVAANTTVNKQQGPQVQVVLYAPSQKKLDDFQVVDVK